MGAKKLDKAKRQAAGYVCFGIFHSLLGARHMIHTLDKEMRQGLTEQELLFLDKRRELILDQAETFRMLGWRFIRSAK